MQGSKSLETLEERVIFSEIMADPERMGLSVKEIAEKLNIGVATIYNRLRDPEIAKLIKEKRAARIKIELPDIDRALIIKAKGGDVRAIELLYQRWDDFIPRHGEVFDQNMCINFIEGGIKLRDAAMVGEECDPTND